MKQYSESVDHILVCFFLDEIDFFLAFQKLRTFPFRSVSSAFSLRSLSCLSVSRGDSWSAQLSFPFLFLYFLGVLSLSFFPLLVLPNLVPSILFFRCFLLIFIFLPFPCQFPLPLVFPLGFCFFSLPFFFFVMLNVAQLIENSGYILYTMQSPI